VPFLDLTETDYAAHAERFEYPYDWHWNRRANRLVGETLADLMIAIAHSRSSDASGPDD
jgi:hypothetical protein